MHRRTLALSLIAGLAVAACGGYGSPAAVPAATAATYSQGDYGTGTAASTVPTAAPAAPTTAPAAPTAPATAPTAATLAPAPASATPTTAPASATPTTAPTTAPAGGAAVAIVDYGFNAADITVKAGTTVTWTNTGQRGHTVTSTDSGFTSSGTLSSGNTYAVTFGTAGSFSYVCAIHGSMKGTVTVTP